MIIIKIYPKNKELFTQLKAFCKEILEICEQIKVSPIVYGSLAYFGYTKNKETQINDIDMLVPEDSFEKMIKILDKKSIRYHYSTKWHTLQIFKEELKIELDSIDFWQKDLPQQFETFDFDGLIVNVVSLESLRKIYKKASEASKDNPEGNLKKFEVLRAIK